MQGEDVVPQPDTHGSGASEPGDGHVGTEERALRSIRKIIRAVDIRSRRLTSTHGVTGPQLACLQLLLEKGPLTATQLGHELELSTSNLVGILDRLESKTFVRRKRDTTDRRRVLVSITGEGQEFTNTIASTYRDPFVKSFLRLDKGEQEAVVAALEKVALLLTEETRNTKPDGAPTGN